MQPVQDFHIGRKEVILSYVSQFFQYGISLLILPIILRNLDAEDLGTWYIFLSISSLISLLDFGFSPSIQRNVAYVASGASELREDGYADIGSKNINEQLLISLLKTSCYIYIRISVCIIVLSLSIGPVYLYFSLKDNFNIYILCSWLLFSISLSIYFYQSYILAFVKGLGLLSQYNLNIIISKSVYILLLALLISKGLGLFSLVIAYFANTILMISLAKRDLKKVFPSWSLFYKIKKYDNLYKILWKNAKNSGIVSLGVFLLSQAGVFLSGLFLPINEVAQLGLLLQIFGIIVVISRVHLTNYIPKFSSLWAQGKYKEIKSNFFKCQLIGYTIFILGVIVIIFEGNIILLKIIHSQIILPSSNIIILYAIFYFMEITHGNCCSLIATSNQIPFTKSAIVSGVISVISTITLCLAHFGMYAFPLGLISGSIPYNSWKWPTYLFKLLKR